MHLSLLIGSRTLQKNFERIRRRIGPFIPTRVDTPIPEGRDWKSADEYAELALDNLK